MPGFQHTFSQSQEQKYLSGIEERKDILLEEKNELEAEILNYDNADIRNVDIRNVDTVDSASSRRMEYGEMFQVSALQAFMLRYSWSLILILMFCIDDEVIDV